MVARNRHMNTVTAKGKVVTGGVVLAGGNYNVTQSSNYCADQVGPGDCDPFNVEKWSVEGGRVNVFNNSSNYWENYRVDFLDNSANFFHLAAPIAQDRLDVDYATEAVARTNPSRPYVDIPVNILELGDIARTIRREGFNTLAALGRQNLRYQFGIAPLVGDLVKLSNFQDQTQRRILELERLAGPRGLRRTLPVGGWSNYGEYTRVLQSNQYFWTGLMRHTTTQSVRAHVRWIPGSTFSTLGTTDRQRLALRSVLGGTIDGATLWEIIPWSWLIDWCSNVGQWFAANRNIIPATLSGVHIMRETRSEIRSNAQPGLNSSILIKVSSKSRRPSFVAPVAHFPFLNAGQMSILASLAVTRR